MQRCGFFDANLVGEEYDRTYLAQHFAAYFASFIGNGVYARSSNQLVVLEPSEPGMTVSVQSGQAWINGYWYENTDAFSLSLGVADGVLSRIDSVVVRLGLAERDMFLMVKRGTPSMNPQAPEVTRSADYYELQLATIRIPAGAISITQSNIEDTRMNSEVCGWVSGVVDQVDTTELFLQFKSYLEEFKASGEQEYQDWTSQQQQEYDAWEASKREETNSYITEQQKTFNAWFDHIKGALSSDVAGNLQAQIDQIKYWYVQDNILYVPNTSASISNGVLTLGTTEV